MSRKQWSLRVSQAGVSAALDKLVAETAAEAKTVVRDVALLLATLGIADAEPVSSDQAGLDRLERWYRLTVPRAGADLDMLEHLLGLVLGEVIIAMHGGEWIADRGRYQSVSAFVVRLREGGRMVDVMAFTSKLPGKKVNGWMDQCAMSRFARDAVKNAFL